MASRDSYDSLKEKWKSRPISSLSRRAPPPVQKKMGFGEKIKKVQTKTDEFFERIKYEKGVGSAFVYYAVLSLVSLGVNMFFAISGLADLSSYEAFVQYFGLDYLVPAMGFVTPLLFYGIGLVSSVLMALVVHLFAKILRGKGGFSATYKALVYASTPSLLFGWISIASLIFGLFSFYLSLKGLSKLHDFSVWRALFALFVFPLIATIGVMYLISLVMIRSVIPLPGL